MQRLDDGTPIDDLSREEVKKFTEEEIEAGANRQYRAGMVDASFWCLLFGVSALVMQLVTGGLELPFSRRAPARVGVFRAHYRQIFCRSYSAVGRSTLTGVLESGFKAPHAAAHSSARFSDREGERDVPVHF
jgi:hypothetical protein